MVSGAYEAIDGVAGFLDLGDGRVLIALLGGVEHAVLEVVIEQASRHSLQGAGQGGDLGEDVDTVLLVGDHLGHAAGLALDALHAVAVPVLVADVTVLVRPGLIGCSVGVHGCVLHFWCSRTERVLASGVRSMRRSSWALSATTTVEIDIRIAPTDIGRRSEERRAGKEGAKG